MFDFKKYVPEMENELRPKLMVSIDLDQKMDGNNIQSEIDKSFQKVLSIDVNDIYNAFTHANIFSDQRSSPNDKSRYSKHLIKLQKMISVSSDKPFNLCPLIEKQFSKN